MSESRDVVIGDIEDLIVANERVRLLLQSGRPALQDALADLKHGADIETTMKASHAGEIRARLTESLRGLEAACHELRLAVSVAGLEEGMSISDLGRSWGISRQLASREAREALTER